MDAGKYITVWIHDHDNLNDEFSVHHVNVSNL